MRTGAMVLVAALLLAGIHEASAQRPRGPGFDGARRPGAGGVPARMEARGPMQGLGLDLRVGQILDRRHTLGLTEAQVEALMGLKADAEARLAPMRQEMQAVRQGLRDGSLTREEARARMEASRESWVEARRTLSDRLDATLEPRQRALLRAAALRRGDRGMVRPGVRRPPGVGRAPLAGRRMPRGGGGGR